MSTRAMGSWPTFHGDVARTGFVNGSAPHVPRSLWNFTAGGRILSSPVIANGSVYVYSEDGFLYSVNQSTGAMIWRTNVGITAASSPTLYGNSVFVASLDGLLYRVDVKTGEILWSVPVGGDVAFASPLAVDGRVYVSADVQASNSPPSGVFAFDTATGSLLWNRTIYFPGELAYSNGIVYVNYPGNYTSGGGVISALNASTGRSVWSLSTLYPDEGGPTVSGGVLYAGGSGRFTEFYALNATTGGVVWDQNSTVEGPPAIAYGRLFASFGGGVGARNQSTGAFLWQFQFRTLVSLSRPAVADGLVFVGGGGTINAIPDPTIYCLNATSGKLVWYVFTNGAVDSSPAIANDTVYIGDSSGVLYAITNSSPVHPISSKLPVAWIEATLIASGVGVLLVYALVSLKRKQSKVMTSLDGKR